MISPICPTCLNLNHADYCLYSSGANDIDNFNAASGSHFQDFLEVEIDDSLAFDNVSLIFARLIFAAD